MNAILHIEQLPPGKMGAVLQGDPIVVTEMLITAMNNNKEMATALIVAVLNYAREKNLDLADLHSIVNNIFHNENG